MLCTLSRDEQGLNVTEDMVTHTQTGTCTHTLPVGRTHGHMDTAALAVDN